MKQFFKWAVSASAIGLVLSSISEGTKEKSNPNPNS